MGTLEQKRGPNGDPKTEKGPHGDRVPQMGSHLGAVKLTRNRTVDPNTKANLILKDGLLPEASTVWSDQSELKWTQSDTG